MDKYDRQIADIVAGRLDIMAEWMDGAGLFQFANPTGLFGFMSVRCACLTMIRRDATCYVIGLDGRPTKSLTQQIRSDNRIPFDSKDIEIKTLPVFRDWQRRLDREIRGICWTLKPSDPVSWKPGKFAPDFESIKEDE